MNNLEQFIEYMNEWKAEIEDNGDSLNSNYDAEIDMLDHLISKAMRLNNGK